MFSHLPINDEANTYRDRYDMSIAYAFDVYEAVTLSLGGSYYWYPELGSNPNRTREVNVGLEWDTFLSPTLAYNYDFDLDQSELILGGSYAWMLESISSDLGLETSAAVAYFYSADPDSDQTPGQSADGYFYGEAAADFTHPLGDRLLFSIGPRVSTNNNGTPKNNGGHESHLWLGTSVTAEF